MMKILCHIFILLTFALPLFSADSDDGDNLGDIIRTIPSPQPTGNNSLAGCCWVNDYLYLFENVFPFTESPRMYKIDTRTGAVVTIIEMPFTGYMMDCEYDSAFIWIVKWYPSSVIYKLDLWGNIISQFIPAIGNYSPRCLMISNDILWIGANLSSNNTKLFSFSESGTLLNEYVTNSVVGFYMCGVKDTEATADSGFFAVDNIGNTIKHFSISNNNALLLEQFVSPATAPDIATGLTFDGQYLWHSSGYGLQGIIWCLDDGINPGFPNVTLQMVPSAFPVVIPSTGGNFNYMVTIHNGDSTALNFSVWITATLPSGAQYQVLQRNLTLGAFATLLRNMVQSVPGTAPPGTYNYEGYIGIYPATIWDESGFDFTKLGFDDRPGNLEKQ